MATTRESENDMGFCEREVQVQYSRYNGKMWLPGEEPSDDEKDDEDDEKWIKYYNFVINPAVWYVDEDVMYVEAIRITLDDELGCITTFFKPEIDEPIPAEHMSFDKSIREKDGFRLFAEALRQMIEEELR